MNKKAALISLTVLACVLRTAGFAQPSNSSNEEIIRKLFATFNRHDIDGLAAFYAPDAYLMSSDFPEPRHGPEGIRKTYSELFAELPNVHDDLKTVITNRDEVAVEFVSTWDISGKLGSGRLEIATFFKLRRGKIISDVSYFNVPSK